VSVLWHNDSFLPQRGWAGLYRRILERARQDGAVIERAVDAVMEATTTPVRVVPRGAIEKKKTERELEYCWSR